MRCGGCQREFESPPGPAGARCPYCASLGRLEVTLGRLGEALPGWLLGVDPRHDLAGRWLGWTWFGQAPAGGPVVRRRTAQEFLEAAAGEYRGNPAAPLWFDCIGQARAQLRDCPGFEDDGTSLARCRRCDWELRFHPPRRPA